MQGLRIGEAFSGVGFTFGTPSDQSYTYYIEGAFINATVSFLLNAWTSYKPFMSGHKWLCFALSNTTEVFSNWKSSTDSPMIRRQSTMWSQIAQQIRPQQLSTPLCRATMQTQVISGCPSTAQQLHLFGRPHLMQSRVHSFVASSRQASAALQASYKLIAWSLFCVSATTFLIAVAELVGRK